MKLLFIDRSTKIQSINELDERPRGGTVNSLFKITDLLSSKHHHEIDVLTDIKTAGQRGFVRWIKEPNKDDYDAIICNRGVGDGYPMINAKKRILWTHDLCHSGFAPQPKLLNAFHTVFMSEYSKKQWMTFYKDIKKYSVIPNGVDQEFINYYPQARNLRKVVYFSHPNRGLKKLPLIADSVNARLKTPVKFVAYSDVDMYPNEPTEDEFAMNYENSDHLYIQKPVKTDYLMKSVGMSGLMVMPTGIPETCSNSVLQSLALGTPVITTGNLGSMGEWVKHKYNGALTKYLPNDYMVYTVEIIRLILEVIENRQYHKYLINNAKRTRNLHSWEVIAKKWDNLLSR